MVGSPISDNAVAQAAWQSFGDLGEHTVIIMTAIAMAESSNIPDNESPGALAGGAGAYGLWQIENNHPELGSTFWSSSWKIPAANGAAARKIYQGQGLAAWSTYSNGAYAQFLSRAQTAAAATRGTTPLFTGGFPNSSAFATAVDNALGLNSGSGISQDPAGGISPNFGANNGQGYANSAGGVLTGNNSISDFLFGSSGGQGLFSGMAPALWIGGGAIIVVLAVVMLNEGTITKVAKVAAL
jgi:Lysozyme like domain